MAWALLLAFNSAVRQVSFEGKPYESFIALASSRSLEHTYSCWSYCSTALLEETCWLLLLKVICTEEGVKNIVDFELAALKGLKYKWCSVVSTVPCGTAGKRYYSLHGPFQTGKLSLRKIKYFFFCSRREKFVLNTPRCQKYLPWLKLVYWYRGVLTEWVMCLLQGFCLFNLSWASRNLSNG